MAYGVLEGELKEEIQNYLRDNLKVAVRKDPVFESYLEVVLKLEDEEISKDSIDLATNNWLVRSEDGY